MVEQLIFIELRKSCKKIIVGLKNEFSDAVESEKKVVFRFALLLSPKMPLTNN